MKRRVGGIVLVLLAVLYLVSCTDRLRTQPEYSGGEPVGIDELAAIREEVEAANATEPETQAVIAEYYWIDGSGTTYHTHTDCPYLVGKRYVAGSLFDAYAACKMDYCSRCAKRDNADPDKPWD